MKIYIVIHDPNYDSSTILGAFKNRQKAEEFRIKFLVENKTYFSKEIFIEEIEMR